MTRKNGFWGTLLAVVSLLALAVGACGDDGPTGGAGGEGGEIGGAGGGAGGTGGTPTDGTGGVLDGTGGDGGGGGIGGDDGSVIERGCEEFCDAASTGCYGETSEYAPDSCISQCEQDANTAACLNRFCSEDAEVECEVSQLCEEACENTYVACGRLLGLGGGASYSLEQCAIVCSLGAMPAEMVTCLANLDCGAGDPKALVDGCLSTDGGGDGNGDGGDDDEEEEDEDENEDEEEGEGDA